MFILIMVYVLAGSPRRTFCIEGSVFRRYQRPTLRLLPAGATVAGWVIFLPLDRRALSTARAKSGLGVFAPYTLAAVAVTPKDSSMRSAATESPLASAIALCNLPALSR